MNLNGARGKKSHIWFDKQEMEWNEMKQNENDSINFSNESERSTERTLSVFIYP